MSKHDILTAVMILLYFQFSENHILFVGGDKCTLAKR